MIRSVAVFGVVLVGFAGRSGAQEAGGFAITRGLDTVAVEQWSRADVELKGSLLRGLTAATRERLHYRATLVDDESAPLIDFSVWRAEDPEGQPARQTARVIFKDDSVAVDDLRRSGGLTTEVLPTARAAIPYVNLSVAFLEQATRRAAQTTGDSLSVPFFNVGGGQTVTGTVRHLGADSSAVRIGTVEFRLRVDSTGRILGGAVPGQGLVITRTDAR
jgi:hypothetical protein